jgi:hypothetical protein
VLALRRKIVERLERIDSEIVVVLIVEGLDALNVQILLVLMSVGVGRCVEGVELLRVRRTATD